MRHSAWLALVLLGAVLTRCGAAPQETMGTEAWEKKLRAATRDIRGYLRRLERGYPEEGRAVMEQIRNGPRDLAREREAARREGPPLTIADFREPAPPAAEDAAPLYRQLVRLLKDRPLDSRVMGMIGELRPRIAYSSAEIPAVRQLLATRQDVMRLLHQAGDRASCSFRANWDRVETLGGNYLAMRSMVRLLSAESYLMARDGRYEEAVANQIRALRVAEHVDAEPVMFNFLFSVALAREALDGMESILLVAGPRVPAVGAVRQAIEEHRPRLDLDRALRGELIFFLTAGRQNRQEIAEKGPESLVAALVLDEEALFAGGDGRPRVPTRKPAPEEQRLWEQILDAYEARHIARMRRRIALLKEPLPRRQALLERMELATEQSFSSPVRLLAAQEVLFVAADLKRARVLAQEAVLTAAAALLAHRARHGEFPAVLTEALPDPPLDPFNGRPLQYRRTGDGFTVQSAGTEDRPYTGRDTPGVPIRFVYPPPPPRMPRSPLDPAPIGG